MQLTEGSYFVFLIAVFFAYLVVVRRAEWRVWLLLAASYLFYSRSGFVPVVILFSISTINFALVRLLGSTEGDASCETRGQHEHAQSSHLTQITHGAINCLRRLTQSHKGRSAKLRRLLLVLAITLDVGVLCVFKYANFFLENVSAGLSVAGISFAPACNLIVPLGISFFIFQNVAYVLDVYRGDCEPAASFIDYLAFVSFFPTIVAGPILRAKDLLPQLRGRVQLDPETGGRALFLIAIGLVKKIAIADYLSANLVDRVFDFPERFSSIEALLAVYAYAVQIYADFSGYSDIAIGSALLLGFKLPENFDSPYRSHNLVEFWRRWHISLSTWLRDYVFFSLAGRRRAGAVLYLSLIATMLIGGLWHGAAWTFVIWGLLHGLGLGGLRAVERIRKNRRGTVLRSRPPLQAIRASAAALAGLRGAIAIMFTFNFVCLTWVFFRADRLDQAIALLRTITNGTLSVVNVSVSALVIIGLGLVSHFIPESFINAARGGFVRLPAFAQAALLFAICVGLYEVASSDVMPFIYARF